MRFVFFFIIIILFIVGCKSKSSSKTWQVKSEKSEAKNKLQKYYLLVDGIEQTEAGLVETNKIDTLYCKDDRSAIESGVKGYYNTVVSIEIGKVGIQPVVPYLTSAKGWAVLDAMGENVKERVSIQFVDSVSQQAVEQAKYTLANTAVQ